MQGFKLLFITSLFFLSFQALFSQQKSEELNKIIEKVQDHKSYEIKEFPLGLYTEDHYRRQSVFASEQLKKLNLLKASEMSQTDMISLELLKYKLQETIDTFEYKLYLNPLLSDAGFHLSLPYNVTQLADYSQVKTYLNKLNAIPVYVDQHLILLRKGLELGITQPRVIFEGYESTYNDQLVKNYKDSYYYSPFNDLPASLSETQKDSVLQAAEKAIKQSVLPEFKKIKKFFDKEYLPKTRSSIGVSETPHGREFYQNRLNYYTTLELTAEEIHQIGLEEVSRINTEMKQIIREVNFEGSFEEFIQFLRTDPQFYADTPEELLKEARNISKKIDAQLPRFFKKLPRKPYGVTPVPDAIAPKYTTGRYISPQEETQPGYYWVNTYDLPSRPLYVLPSLTAHEAVPGHHLQISLNSELGDSIPKFRRRFYLSAYGEGWGLYSEFLAEEMGVYTTPYEMFGKLTYEQWRACRLVVDTGIHALGWTKEQAVDFLRINTALSFHEINTEVDRYISWPGQAVSYKIGELKIRELRKKVEKEFGEDFDMRDFHEVILSQGTVTLAIMEKLVDDYITSSKEVKN
ncbi:uncharacterized protein (DUF885 family) [Gillisia mitskevichiae]|uniref:Uncharacterized protein (DUF885 family) n=1 Tax=Gillisia mitskevichiae TaxID=270921 RepID=A0A495PZ35_9FLAO|nr:DUF885 domain-containing protein [Gillisia mitskevichiae]RKS55120.1 uncharacterized protein (DUF885 family) [Gillisia mitskevichiae]